MFGGVVEGVKGGFGGVGEVLRGVKGVFEWVGEKLEGGWEWFKKVIGGVKGREERVKGWGERGVMLGEGVGEGLMVGVNGLKKVGSGIEWVVEKVGVMKKE